MNTHSSHLYTLLTAPFPAGVAVFASMTLIIAVMNRFVRHQIGLKEARQKFLIAAAAMYIIGHAATFAAPSRLTLSWQYLSLLPSKTLGSAYSSVSPSLCFSCSVILLRMRRRHI